MASAVDQQKFFAENKLGYYNSGDATTATDIGWVDMKDYEEFAVLAGAASLTGTGITALTIVANSESDGTGDEVVIKEHAVGSAPDAEEDYLVLSCSAEEIAHLGEASGYNLRYVSAKVTTDNAADIIALTYFRTRAKHKYLDLTADYVSS